MAKSLVVFGCPVFNRSWVLNQWWGAIAAQAQLTDYRWKVVFAYSESEDDTLGKLEQMQDWHDAHIIDAGPSPRTREEMDQHWWHLERFEYMAGLRNHLLDYAIDQDAEYFFSVDSDIILPPMAFETLMQGRGDAGAIAPLVNMAVHLGAIAYNYMDAVDGATPSYLRTARVMPETVFDVDAIMAAMLIHRSLFEARWSSHEQGEDLGWSWHARQLGKRLLVDPNVRANHLQRSPV